MSRWWPRWYRHRLLRLLPRAAPDSPSPLEQETVVPADPRERLLGVDHQLAVAVSLLNTARTAGDAKEVARLTEWIDSRLDQRLQLTRD
jgi:hypothetical protein